MAAFPQWETDHVLVIPKKAVMDALQRHRGNGDNALQGKGIRTCLLEEKDVRKIRRGIPCSPEDSQFKDWNRTGCGYQFVKKLENGWILAYEYYDGAFLLLDGELSLLRKVPCRLPIELVRQQRDVQWRKAQCRSGYSGRISESGSIPFMMERFLRIGAEDRERVRASYRREYRIL